MTLVVPCTDATGGLRAMLDRVQAAGWRVEYIQIVPNTRPTAEGGTAASPPAHR